MSAERLSRQLELDRNIGMSVSAYPPTTVHDATDWDFQLVFYPANAALTFSGVDRESLTRLRDALNVLLVTTEATP